MLQFCDFFCSILAFWVTLISLAHLPPSLAAVAHMAGVLMVAVGVEWNRTALVVFLVPVALGLLVPVSRASWRCSGSEGQVEFSMKIQSLFFYAFIRVLGHQIHPTYLTMLT